MLDGSTAVQRMRAFSDLGHELHCVTTEPVQQTCPRPSILSRICRKITGPRDRSGANYGIIEALQTKEYDVLWIDKGLTIHPQTLLKARILQPDCRIVGFSPDDMMNSSNQSRNFLAGLPYYDCFVSTKSYNVDELRGFGCRDVLFMENGYDPHTHRPLPVGAVDRVRLGGDVGFIGQWEPQRAESLRKLAVAGIPVRVWGYTWERMRNVPTGLILENRPLWGDEYARAICSFEINLCFLRKCNRDLQTTRSVEIPACGGFMLAEESDEHLHLFSRAHEADFFSSDQELIRRVQHYLDNPEERRRIAANGLDRCLHNGYSYKDRLCGVFERIYSLPRR